MVLELLVMVLFPFRAHLHNMLLLICFRISYSNILLCRSKLQNLSPEADYPFTEKPSEEFFCPVTLGLLLQPHLTLCCGKHISEESAVRIQRRGGPCPLYNSPEWTTVLNKHFRRQVKELQVFCQHKQKGFW